jgi:3-methyladenine DNA glycosylase AlkD
LKPSVKRSSPASTKPDPAAIASNVDRELRRARNPARALAEKRYLKSDLTFLGAGVPALRGVAKRVVTQYPDLDRGSLLKLVRALWAKPLHERRMVAIEVLRMHRDRLGPTDLRLVERLIRDSRTWAYVDELAVAVAGRLVERFPDLRAILDRWSTDPNFWVRRSAMLALLPPLRRGEGDFERLGRYADGMLEEREFFIRKAIGWTLRETGKKRPSLVYEWLLPRCARASGVTVREAVRWLSAEQRQACVAAYRSATGRTVASVRAPR